MKVVKHPDIGMLSLSRYEDRLIVYFETEMTDPDPRNIVTDGLKKYPSGETLIRMPDIFHFSRPLNREHWERRVPKVPNIRVNRLRYHMISSYIFYHHQLQEERRNKPARDKYGIICLDGNFMVFYLEDPAEPETMEIQGKLATSNSPDNWGELMARHFIPWEDFNEPWKPATLLDVDDYI
ncbi:MAG: hypothetical protein LBV27_07780 [Oscillospiraceae bacterium]|nr:hypothetical protein [Oscillospiraceae bacterium]